MEQGKPETARSQIAKLHSEHFQPEEMATDIALLVAREGEDRGNATRGKYSDWVYI